MATATLKMHTAPSAVAEFDHSVVWITILLLALGLVMVYSASIAIAEAGRSTGQQSMYYLMRHAIFLAVSVTAGLIAFQIPVATWQRFAPYLFVVGLVLIALVLIPGIGREVNGARRWIPLIFLICSRRS